MSRLSRYIQKRLQYRTSRVLWKLGLFPTMDIDGRSPWFSRDFNERTGGFYPHEDWWGREIARFDPIDSTRRNMILLLLREVEMKSVPGSFAELGVYKGRTALLLRRYAPERELILFDTFEGFSDEDIAAESDNAGISLSRVREFSTNSSNGQRRFADTNFLGNREQIRFIRGIDGASIVCQGHFPESIPIDFRAKRFAFVHIDSDFYQSVFDGLTFFHPRMSPGGYILIHDYNAWPGARKAVDDFFRDCDNKPIPMPDKSGSALVAYL
jgi:O-methyltransferase